MISRARSIRIRSSQCNNIIKRSERQTGRRFLATDTSESTNHVIFSGIQPTGVPHLGNYLGALQQWVKLQEMSPPSTKLLYSVVDLHAYTLPQNPGNLERFGRETLATFLAIGLDPERSILFYQSSVRLATFQVLRLIISGPSSFGALLALVLYSLHGLLVSYDTMEGTA